MLDPENYSIAASLFIRLLGFIFFWAFGAFLFQIKGLIGSNGILPVSRFLSWVRNYYPKNYFVLLPSVFWINCSDIALLAVVGSGTVLSIFLMLGFFPPIILVLLFVLYLSIVSVGQDFLSFGWESFLLEITLNAFLLSLTSSPNVMVWISINLLLFRFHFQAGAVKIQSRDPNWRNLTALAYHYESQPIPNAVAWYVHKFPIWFHKMSTLFMFAAELVFVFAIFGTDSMRFYLFWILIGLQWTIWITGNFSFLNHLTAAFCVILIANPYFPSWMLLPAPSSSAGIDIFCTIMGGVLTLLQCLQLWHHFLPNEYFYHLFRAVSQFHIINPYGIFAVMTTERHEIVFEGSDDGTEWKEYTFFQKPSEINKRPSRISPYQPRIDWQAWFLPFGRYRHELWLNGFMYHLLKGTPEVLKLIRGNPFPDHPPRYVRALMYLYTFTSFREKKETGNWWNRTYEGIFARPRSIDVS